MLRSISLHAAAFAMAAALGAQTLTPSPGFTLMDSMSNTTGSLLDNATQSVHTWSFSARPGMVSYLDRDGHVLRAYRTGAPGVGVGGALERVAFDGTVLWDYTPSGPGVQHHDIQELPNGNVLIVITHPFTQAEMVALGRNPFTTTATWQSERIIEVQPTGPTSGTVVWEWRAIDHLVQDFLATSPNFDVVSARPERINVNYPVLPTSLLWIHMNGIDYNPDLDQIVVSSRNFSELWVIDHSTTTAEAAGSTGGNSGKGGDLLYRWGNPDAYSTAGAQQLFGQHDVNWIRPGRPGQGHLLCFNNRRGLLLGLGDASAVTEIDTPVDPSGNYAHIPGTAYGPAAAVWEYMAPVPTSLYSGAVSGAERLPNGNTLICPGQQGRVFEVGFNDQTVWETTWPITFKARRYERSLWAGADELSAAAGGSVPFDLVAGTEHAGKLYLLGGSLGGTEPGFSIGGATIPLNPDYYFLNATGTSILPGSIGIIDAGGRAAAAFTMAPGSGLPFIGTQLHHAFVVVENNFAISHVSNPLPLVLVP